MTQIDLKDIQFSPTAWPFEGGPAAGTDVNTETFLLPEGRGRRTARGTVAALEPEAGEPTQTFLGEDPR